MKFLDKLGLALFSILVLIISLVICLVAFGTIDFTVITAVLTNILASENGMYITIGVSVILMVLAIKCLFFPGYEKGKLDEDDGILLQNDSGKLLITRGTIQNIVTSTVNGFKEIEASESSIDIDSNNDVCVNLEISVKKETVIKDVSTKLQSSIKNSVKKATDLEIKEINIKINEFEEEKRTEENIEKVKTEE